MGGGGGGGGGGGIVNVRRKVVFVNDTYAQLIQLYMYENCKALDLAAMRSSTRTVNCGYLPST